MHSGHQYFVANNSQSYFTWYTNCMCWFHGNCAVNDNDRYNGFDNDNDNNNSVSGVGNSNNKHSDENYIIQWNNGRNSSYQFISVIILLPQVTYMCPHWSVITVLEWPINVAVANIKLFRGWGIRYPLSNLRQKSGSTLELKPLWCRYAILSYLLHVPASDRPLNILAQILSEWHHNVDFVLHFYWILFGGALLW